MPCTGRFSFPWMALKKIIPPLEGEKRGPITVTSTQQEEAERVNAIDYLREVIQRHGESPGQWCCDAVVRSVAEGISSFADREGVEVIAMYTHGRKGLAKLI